MSGSILAEFTCLPKKGWRSIMDLKELQGLYDAGRHSECLQLTLNVLSTSPGGESEKKYNSLAGWCSYRLGNFEQAKKSFRLAGEMGLEGLYYLSVYVDHDAEEADRLFALVGETVNQANGALIRGRTDSEYPLTRDQVATLVARFSEEAVVGYANLLHNAGRWYHHIAATPDDLEEAKRLLFASLQIYGLKGSWHHRGAANFWLSVVEEVLGNEWACFGYAAQSLACWKKQAEVDPTDRNNTSAANAAKRLAAVAKPISPELLAILS